MLVGLGDRRELPEVLLIDDDMVSREVIATLLTLRGYAVHTASGGEESLRMLAPGGIAPGIILVDAQMTGLSGAELIAELRKRSQASIFLISGSEVSTELRAAADGFLMKPFAPDDLQALQERHSPQPKPEEPELPVINPKTLAQFREMMPEEAVREIYMAVAADLKKSGTALKEAVAAGNAAEVRRIGHSIKGGCAMAGVAQASRIGASIENESNQLDNSSRLLQDLDSATQDLESMLEHEFPA